MRYHSSGTLKNVQLQELMAHHVFRSATTISALDVLCPCDAGFGSVLLGDLIAVAEHFCDQGSGDFGDQCLYGGVASALQIDAERSQPLHDCLRVDVSAGPDAGEEPRGADRAAAGAQVGPMAEVIVKLGGEWLRNGDRVFAERDTGFSAHLRDRGGLQGGDLGQRLRIEQQQHAGDAVGQTFRVTGEQLFEPGQALVLRDCGGRSRLPEADLHRDVELASLSPDEERPNEVAGSRA